MTALLAWFNGLPFKLIACGAAIGLILLAIFMVYREGKHSAQADQLRQVAANNAHIAQQFAKQVETANDIAAQQRTRAEEAEDQARTLKEQINAVAKGNASPGVDRAIHGLQSGSAAPAQHTHVSRSR